MAQSVLGEGLKQPWFTDNVLIFLFCLFVLPYAFIEQVKGPMGPFMKTLIPKHISVPPFFH